MRLSAEQVKQAMLHSDPEVREAALFYFTESQSPDPSIMPIVIETIGQFGLDAFSLLSIENLVQTDDSVAWLIQEIERVGPGTVEQEVLYRLALIKALFRADAAILKRHEAMIQAATNLDDDSKAIIADRILVATLPPEVLWRELTDFCDAQHDPGELADKDYRHIDSIVDALSRYPDQVADRVLSGLSDEDSDDEWLEGFLIRLAGQLRLTPAIPLLMDRFDLCGEWVCEEAEDALLKIGTDAVVEAISSRCTRSGWIFRLEVTFCLRQLHCDLSVQKSLDLLRSEKNLELQGHFLQAVLTNFSTEGIEPARQYILHRPQTPDVLDVRFALLVACKMMGETFPEFDAWLEDSKTDGDFRRQWYAENSLDDPDDDFYGEDDLGDEWDELDGDEEEDGGFDDGDDLDEDDLAQKEESITVVRHEPRVGRNDPCPCGSGKKFKKCCYGKADL
jgi:hypothetical protein